jgi:hypothetical protein
MTNTTIYQFRQEVYQSITQRSDTGMDLLDALTGTTLVESPVSLSESPLFRRSFSAVYEFLQARRWDTKVLQSIFYRFQPEDAEKVAGYEVYITDCTDEPHPEAETLPDRTQAQKGKYAPKIIGHRYSWLVRAVQQRTSWCAPQQVARVGSDSTDSSVAVTQVKALDKQSDHPKVIVGDSLYGNDKFLAALTETKTVKGLVRLRSNRVLYEAPEPYQGKGRPPKHGQKFHLNQPHRAPDETMVTTVWGHSVKLEAWQKLHFYQLPLLVGLVLTITFLRADGTPRYQRPIYLFWTGPLDVPLVSLCQMYLWRFAIEHMFRFLKQHLGLTSNRSPNLVNHELWVWTVALAYYQLLLIRHEVATQRPPWHPTTRDGEPRPLTPRQVQRVALTFLLKLGTPARSPQPAGKGHGRVKGYTPKPRQRHGVVKKGQKKAQTG